MKKELMSILSRLLRLLEAHHVQYSVVVRKYLGKFDDCVTEEEVRLVSEEVRKNMLGGMGSLNDLWISRDNGHVVSDEKKANSDLEKLREELRHILL